MSTESFVCILGSFGEAQDIANRINIDVEGPMRTPRAQLTAELLGDFGIKGVRAFDGVFPGVGFDVEDEATFDADWSEAWQREFNAMLPHLTEATTGVKF